MVEIQHPEVGQRLVLNARTAAELMMPNPVSIRDTATVREAVAMLTDKGFSAAPVIDEAGRPVGVLSRADILAYERERGSAAGASASRAAAATESGPPMSDSPQVRDLMTPALFCVTPITPAGKVVSEMLALKVHRLFVVDGGSVLVGIISTLDILRHLQPEL